MSNSKSIKFWPQKDNRTVLMEVEIYGGTATFQFEMDLEEAAEAEIDLRDARTIVAEDWISG